MPPKQSFIQKLLGDSGTVNYGAQRDADRTRFLDSIGANETSVVPGNKYASFQDSGVKEYGRAMGRYRVTEGELKAYAKRYTGRDINSDEFQKSSVAQDQYMTGKYNALTAQGYTPQQIADIHNKGMTNAGRPGDTMYQSPDYVAKFNANYLKR